MSNLLRQCPEIGCYDIQIEKSTVRQVILSADGHDTVVGNLSDDINMHSVFVGGVIRYKHRVSIFLDVHDHNNCDAFIMARKMYFYDPIHHPIDNITIKIITDGKYYLYSNVIEFELGMDANEMYLAFENVVSGDIGEQKKYVRYDGWW